MLHLMEILVVWLMVLVLLWLQWILLNFMGIIIIIIINNNSGEPANFLDVGGGASKEGVKTALNIIFKDDAVKCVLINIFGGIVRCDMIASATIDAIKDLRDEGSNILPIVIRLAGTNSKEGMQIISDSASKLDIKIYPVNTLDEAAKKSVTLL